ncbi:MAG: type II CRISPR-associated endonuclease Cas1 [Brevinema sp.]
MGWRILTVDSAGKLSLRDNQLVFKTKDQEKSVAIEDLECVLLENQQIDITHPLLSRLAEEGVILVSTDPKYRASGITVSYWGQYKKIEVLELQLRASEPLKKRCWQKIISQKIANQALNLQKLHKNGTKELLSKSKEVQSGDTTFVEGGAAAFYFARLFESRLFEQTEEKFIRQQHYDKEINLLNAGLNYCYALIRSVLIRHITASGLLPYLGIHHRSKVNAFNLADDLMEVYRPMAEYHVHQYLDYLYCGKDETISLEIRRELQKIFTYQVQIADNWIKFPASCRTLCHSYINLLECGEIKNFKVPREWRQK